MENLVSARSPFALSILVAAAFVRIVTNRRIFADMTPLPIALGVIDALVARPNCRLVGPGPDHWTRFSTLCRETDVKGKLISDAQHAAVAIENGCTLVSRDGDFARFESAGLRWTHLVLD